MSQVLTGGEEARPLVMAERVAVVDGKVGEGEEEGGGVSGQRTMTDGAVERRCQVLTK